MLYIELHVHIKRMDINNDGVLQCEEFVQMVRFLMPLGKSLLEA